MVADWARECSSDDTPTPAPSLRDIFNTMHELSRCPVCDALASGATPVFTADRSYSGKPFPSRVVRWRCGHSFLNPSPGREELLSFYEDDYHCFATTADDAARIGRWIEQRRRGDRFNHVPIIPGGRFLDVGC